ncbi:MAG: chloride channel protein [Chloroflexota bacterium]
MRQQNWMRWWPGKWPPSENTLLFTLAIAVGLGTAVGVWLFQKGIEVFQEFYQKTLLDSPLHNIAPWSIIIVLGLAGLIVGFLKDRYVGEERHHGVAGIMEATALAGGRLRYRRMPMKAALASFSIGAGASVGPEDPSVQIGANLGSMFGQWLRLSDERVRLLVAAGVACGIACAFQAPITGVFFALEVILGDLSVSSSGVVVLAAVVATVFTQTLEQSGAELGIRTYALGGPSQLPFYILLGLLVAPLSAIFIRMLYWQHDLWHEFKLPHPVKTMLAGIVVGAIAVFIPQVMGTGRETMNALLNGNTAEFTLLLLLALVVGKMLATTISLGGGFVGGMFAPALFVGAAFGFAFGVIANALFPGMFSANPAAYAMAGMAAAMTGVIRAPITANLLLFELTRDYNLILPIMLATSVCLIVVERLAPDGIYHLGLKRKGIQLAYGRDIDLMQVITVGEAMNTKAQTIPATLPAMQLETEFAKTNTHGLIVLDEEGLLFGIITLQDLARAREAGELENHTAGDICTREVLTVTPESPLSTALKLVSPNDVGRLPVVDSDNPRKVVGLLRRRDIVRAYDIALQRKMDERHLARHVRLEAYSQQHIMEMRVKLKAPADGKLISELSWPQGSIVASIRRGGSPIIPHGSTRLLAGDLLTVVTTPADEHLLVKMISIPAPQLEEPKSV